MRFELATASEYKNQPPLVAPERPVGVAMFSPFFQHRVGANPEFGTDPVRLQAYSRR